MYHLFKKRFEYYKKLGEDAFFQLSEEQLFWTYHAEGNSIATLIRQISVNMQSSWTKSLTEDGEKPLLNHNLEFTNNFTTKEEVLLVWEKGWSVLLNTLDVLVNTDGNKAVLIRGEQLTIHDVLLRELGHYSYHVGQIVLIAKMIANKDWNTLNNAKNYSENNTSEFKRKQSSSEIHDNSSPVCFANSDEVRNDYLL